MLEVRNISKSYITPRGPLPILANVTLSLAAGDAISIIGPSGTGKSTLLYILGALDPPTSGEGTLDGRGGRLQLLADINSAAGEQGFAGADDTGPHRGPNRAISLALG